MSVTSWLQIATLSSYIVVAFLYSGYLVNCILLIFGHLTSGCLVFLMSGLLKDDFKQMYVKVNAITESIYLILGERQELW